MDKDRTLARFKLNVIKILLAGLKKLLELSESRRITYSYYTLVFSNISKYFRLIAIDQSFYKDLETRLDVSLRTFYKIRFGKTAPSGRDRYEIMTDKINGSVREKDMPRCEARYGVLEGGWDQKAKGWEDTFWEGIRERFKDGKSWEDTIYYEKGIGKLNNGRDFGPLNGEQTVENFETYLKTLDNLFRKIENHGYDKSSYITVNIGRNGEFLLVHGNHRRIMADILDVDKLPVKVAYRHSEWQEKRIKSFTNPEKLTEAERKHPDIKSVIDYK